MTTEIIKALTKAQLEIEAPEKDKIGGFKNRYSSLDAIYQAVRIPLAKNGITIVHSVEKSGDETVLVTTLHHTSGETVSNRIPFITEKSGNQGMAITLTYTRRYAVCSILALPSDDDTDGEDVKPKNTTIPKKEEPLIKSSLSDQEIKMLTELGEKNPKVRNNLFAYYGIDSFADPYSKIAFGPFETLKNSLLRVPK